MATMIEAYVAYGPKLKRKPTVRLDELSERLADTTGLRPSQVMMVLLELKASLLHYNRRGAALELPGIGTFTPGVKGDGRLHILYRPDRSLIGALDNPQTFLGEIANRGNVGLTPEDFKVLWDAEHPDDPLDLPVRGEVGATTAARATSRQTKGRAGGKATGRKAAAGTAAAQTAAAAVVIPAPVTSD
jgi:hypothetical protein